MNNEQLTKITDALYIVDTEIKSRSIDDYDTQEVSLKFAADLIENKIDHSKIKYYVYSSNVRVSYSNTWWQDTRPKPTYHYIIVIPAPSKYMADIYKYFHTQIAAEHEVHSTSGKYESYRCNYNYHDFQYLGYSDNLITEISIDELSKSLNEPKELFKYLNTDNCKQANNYDVSLYRNSFKDDVNYKIKLLSKMKIKDFQPFMESIPQIAQGLVSIREEPIMVRLDRAFKKHNISDYFVTSDELTSLSKDFDTVFDLILQSIQRFNSLSSDMLKDYMYCFYNEQLDGHTSLYYVKSATESMYSQTFRRAEVIYNSKTKKDDNAHIMAEYGHNNTIEKGKLSEYFRKDGAIYKMNNLPKTIKKSSVLKECTMNALKYKNDYCIVRKSYRGNLIELNSYIEKNIYKPFVNITPINITEQVS